LSFSFITSLNSLVLLFCNASGLLLLQGLEFFAILQIIVYIGALSVMFLFVVMLLNISLTEIVSYQRATYYTVAQSFLLWAICLILIWPASSCSSGVLFRNLGLVSGGTVALPTNPLNQYQFSYAYQPTEILMKQLGLKLYLEYPDLLIMASLVLLVAMIGAVILALKKQPKQAPQLHRDFKCIVHTIE
jgi:NADH:ubiquinone oxidoreductase subunit 6 (subunit J)